MATTTAKDVIRAALAHRQREIEEAYEAVRRAEDRILELERLIPFAECLKCGAFLDGCVYDAQQVYEAAKLVGRQDDPPCAFCDTPEQAAAYEKALEIVQR